MIRHMTWFCCVGLLLARQLSGQSPPPEQPEVHGRRAWVVATDVPKDVENPLPVLSDETINMVQLHLRSVGQPFRVDDTGVVRAVKVNTSPDGKVTYTDLAVSQIPEGVREALIVLVPKAQGEGGPRFNSKVIDLAQFKKGGCLYVNLVKTKIGITIGEHKAVIEPGGMEFINPLESKKIEVYPVRFFYEVPKEPKAEWKLMTSSKMAIFESRREICVFYYNPEIENVDFRGIPFMTPPPPPQTPKP